MSLADEFDQITSLGPRRRSRAASDTTARKPAPVDTVQLKDRMRSARASGPVRDEGPGDPRHDLALARLDTLAKTRSGAIPARSTKEKHK